MQRKAVGRSFALATLLLPLVSTAIAGEEVVKVQVVKYAGLGEAISQLKGKVVVVDFWADT